MLGRSLTPREAAELFPFSAVVGVLTAALRVIG